MSNTDCPSCSRGDFDTERAMKCHHVQAHDESIAGRTVECSQCGKEKRAQRKRFEEQENFFCSDQCYADFLSGISGKDHPLYNSQLVECVMCGEEVERTPSEIKNVENTFCSRECLGKFQSQHRTGDWSHLWDGGEVETECNNCGKSISRIQWQYQEYDNHYCSLQCFGDYRLEGDEPISVEYGEMWDEQREEALERDNHECQLCGISQEDHYDEYGMDLSVHHKVRFLDFDDPSEAHRLENLVTLCCECHRKVESGGLEI